MITITCDRCEDVFEKNNQTINKIKDNQRIKPSDKTLMDLCPKCIEEFISLQKELNDKQLRESLKLSLDFLG